MTANLIPFVPKANLDAKGNLVKFICYARKYLVCLDNTNEFDNHGWNVQSVTKSDQKFIYFTQYDVQPKNYYSNKKRPKNTPAPIPNELLLRGPFLDFAKAMIAYLNTWKKGGHISTRVASLRHLEEALFQTTGSTCPTDTTPEILNKACSIAFEKVSRETAYDRGKQLQMIYTYMVKLGLVAIDDEWYCQIKARKHLRNRVGLQFENERNLKLPHPKTLEALAEIFNSNSTDPKDIVCTSICALLLCEPGRVKEILHAPLNIIADDWQDPETGEVGNSLRWFPKKGAKPLSKTIIPSMRDIAIKAVENLKKLSDPARKIAIWYEGNPTKIYLKPEFEYLRDEEYLSYDQVNQILFGENVRNKVGGYNRVRKSLKLLNVPFENICGKRDYQKNVRFKDLEIGVISKLPIGFPILEPDTGIKFSQALCITRLGEFELRATPWACCIARINYNQLKNQLKSTGNVKSVFERWGYQDEIGNFLSLNSHQLRHYLNTLMRQSGTLKEEEIANWSGRKNVGQNAVYNHVSDREIITKLRNAVGDPAKSVGPFKNIDNRVFIKREDFADVKIITAHITEFGYCVHDYAQSPCQIHRDCMNCTELVCIKGNIKAEQNLRNLQKELMKLQADAHVAFNDDVLGAAEWYKYQTQSLDRVNQLLSIIDDPQISSGSVIQLSGLSSPSIIELAEQKRALKIQPISKSITNINNVQNKLSNSVKF